MRRERRFDNAHSEHPDLVRQVFSQAGADLAKSIPSESIHVQLNTGQHFGFNYLRRFDVSKSFPSCCQTAACFGSCTLFPCQAAIALGFEPIFTRSSHRTRPPFFATCLRCWHVCKTIAPGCQMCKMFYLSEHCIGSAPICRPIKSTPTLCYYACSSLPVVCEQNFFVNYLSIDFAH